MDLTQREKKILDILRKEGYTSVESLAKQTYISASSIRRDLQRLEGMSLVERSYGGVELKSDKKAAPIRLRKTKEAAAKRKIARIAEKTVKNGQTVILDSSTTAFYMVDVLAKYRDITVITNNLETALRAATKGLTVYTTGGKSTDGSPVLTGAYAEEMLEKISADIVFFSSFALSRDGVITDPSESENKMRKIMLTRARKKVLLIDKSKLGRVSTHVLCTLDDIDEHFSN